MLPFEMNMCAIINAKKTKTVYKHTNRHNALYRAAYIHITFCFGTWDYITYVQIGSGRNPRVPLGQHKSLALAWKCRKRMSALLCMSDGPHRQSYQPVEARSCLRAALDPASMLSTANLRPVWGLGKTWRGRGFWGVGRAEGKREGVIFLMPDYIYVATQSLCPWLLPPHLTRLHGILKSTTSNNGESLRFHQVPPGSFTTVLSEALSIARVTSEPIAITSGFFLCIYFCERDDE